MIIAKDSLATKIIIICLWGALAVCAVAGLHFKQNDYQVKFHSLTHLEGKAWQLSLEDLPFPQKYIYKFVSDSTQSNTDSTLILYENGERIEPAHSLHRVIISDGGGTYSHWRGRLYFSTSDGTAPTVSNYEYTGTIDLSFRNSVLLVFFGIFFFLCAATAYPFCSKKRCDRLWRKLSLLFIVLFCRKLTSGINRKKNALLIFCGFIFVFIFTLIHFADEIDGWKLAPDSTGYWFVSFKDPWHSSMRTPGYAMYLDVLGALDGAMPLMTQGLSAVQQMETGKADEQIDKALTRVVRSTYLLYAFSLSILAVSLAQFLPIGFATIFPCISVWCSKLPAPDWVLADQPVAFITILFLAFGLFFIGTKRLVFFFTLCLCAVFAFLVKPGAAFLPLIAGVIGLAFFISSLLKRENIRAMYTFFVGIFLCAGTMLWPALLYMESGFFVTSQMGAVTKTMFAISLIQPGDENIFENAEDKALVAEIIRQKPDVDAKLDETVFPDGRDNYSDAYIYLYGVNEYGWRFFPQIFREMRPEVNFDDMEYSRIAKRIMSPIVRTHFKEYLKMVGRSFLSAFEMYEDMYPSPFAGEFNFARNNFLIFCAMFTVIVAGLLVGAKMLRLPVLLIGAVHPLSALLTSIGHVVTGRYLEPTEWCLILAVLIAVYSLACRFIPDICRKIICNHA